MAMTDAVRKLIAGTLLSVNARNNLERILSGYTEEAPEDGTPYARQDGTWVAAGGGGGGGLIRPAAVFDGAGDVLVVGSQARATVTADCTITGWTIIADQSGSCVVDVLRSTYAGYPTTTSLTGSAKPTLTAATKATSTTLTGWTTALTAGDVLVFNLDSATTVKQVYIVLDVS